MRQPVAELDLRRARSLDEALAVLRDEQRTPLAGATDLYVALNFGTLQPRKFLDIHALDELRGISLRGDTLVIGALATYTAVLRSAEVRARLPMLGEAARLVGGPQIQNRGTIGGNLANASPAGDTLPVLMTADAVAVLRSAGAERRVPVTELYTGYRATVIRSDELIHSVEVPAVAGRQWFRKVGTRAAQAISKIMMAGVRGPRPAIAFGSVGPTVVRARAAETVLGGGGSIDEAVAALARDIAPIDDVRSTGEYRMRVAGNLLRRFWVETE